MKIFIWIFASLFVAMFASADPANCFDFRGCIDGSDWIYVNDGHLTLMHDNYQFIGSLDNCPAEYVNVVYIDNVPIEIHGQGFSYYHGDALFDEYVNLNDIQTFTQVVVEV